MTSAVGSHLSAVVQHDLEHGKSAAATTAEAKYNAFEQSLTSPEQAGTGAVVLNSAQWNQPVITWSLADSPGTASAPFSSYMSSDYAATVQEAFSAWAAVMPGVTLRLADGERKTAHYAFCTGFMALGMMLPGYWSGRNPVATNSIGT